MSSEITAFPTRKIHYIHPLSSPKMEMRPEMGMLGWSTGRKARISGRSRAISCWPGRSADGQCYPDGFIVGRDGSINRPDESPSSGNCARVSKG
jgi:hypothetical protein